jgi:hypothetical protein
MYFADSFDALYFYDNSIGDNEVRPVLSDEMALVQYGDSNLSTIEHLDFIEFDAERFLIRRFWQTGTEMSVNFNRTSDDLFR